MVGKFFLVSAPSGAGKTSLVLAVIQKISPYVNIQRLITYTTKKPRPGETAGVDYHYISTSEFEQKIEQGFFLEYSKAYEHYYGTPRNALDYIHAGTSYIAIVDRVGAEKIIAQYAHAIPIWIYTKNITVLQERLLQRGSDSRDAIERRMLRAQQELDLEKQHRLYRYHLLNDDFNEAVNDLYEIVYQHIFR